MARKKKVVEEVKVEETKEPTLFDIISTHTWHPADAIATIIEDNGDGNEKEITS